MKEFPIHEGTAWEFIDVALKMVSAGKGTFVPDECAKIIEAVQYAREHKLPEFAPEAAVTALMDIVQPKDEMQQPQAKKAKK